MADEYTYDSDTLDPWLAGLASGAVAAIVGTLLAFALRSPDDLVANSLTVAVGALVIGLVSGMLWRRLRATSNGLAAFRWAMVGGFVVSLVAIAIIDQVALSSLIPYAAPIAGVIFFTVGWFTPYLATLYWSWLIPAVLTLVALAMGVGLFGRGNVESGELSLTDLTTTTMATPVITATGSTATTIASPIPTDGSQPETFAEYTVNEGVATWTVPETLQGLATVAVGRSESLTGLITPGEGFEFTIDLTTFTSDQARRDRFVRDMFDADPLATFNADAFDLPDVPDGEVVLLAIPGTMTVNGTPVAVVWDVEAVKEGAVISVTGELDITLTEFGLTPPRLGFVQVEDEAHLEVLFQAIGL